MASVVRMPSVLAGAAEAAIASWLVAARRHRRGGHPLAEIETEKAVVEYAAEAAGVVGRLVLAGGEPARSASPSRCSSAPARRTPASTPPWAARPLPAGARRWPRRFRSRLPALRGPAALRRRRPNARAAATRGAARPGSSPAPWSARSPARGHRPRPRSRGRARTAGSSGGISSGLLAAGAARPATAPPAAPRRRPRGRPALAARAPGGQPPRAPGSSRTRRCAAPSPAASPRARRPCRTSILRPSAWSTSCSRCARRSTRRRRSRSRSTTSSIMAAAAAFRDVPEANVTWTDEGLVAHENVDISIAVATEGGLVTPVLRGVGGQAALGGRRGGRGPRAARPGPAAACSTSSRAAPSRSRTSACTARWSSPRSSTRRSPAILAVGAARPQPVVADGAVTVATVMRCTLSVDHRAIDGALAARWLAAFTARMRSPLAEH